MKFKCLVKNALKECPCKDCKDRRYWKASLILAEIQHKIFQIIFSELETSHKFAKENKE